jgi:hypothetical protein
MARPRKTIIVRSRKTGLKFEHNKAKIDFASLRPVARDEAKKLGATPGTLFAPRASGSRKTPSLFHYAKSRSTAQANSSGRLCLWKGRQSSASRLSPTLLFINLLTCANEQPKCAGINTAAGALIAIFPKTKLEPSKQQSVGNRIIAREPSNTSRTKKRKHICNVRPWRSTPKARQTRRRSPRFKFSTGF